MAKIFSSDHLRNKKKRVSEGRKGKVDAALLSTGISMIKKKNTSEKNRLPAGMCLSADHHRLFPDSSNAKHKLVRRSFPHESVMIRRSSRKRPASLTPVKVALRQADFFSQAQYHSIVASPFSSGISTSSHEKVFNVVFLVCLFF